MFSETPHDFETTLNSKEEIIKFILERIIGYTKEEFDKPINNVQTGDKMTTLNQFLDKPNNVSEWTDPHGFKINASENKFKITISNLT